MGKDFDSFFKELVQERIDEIQCQKKQEAWENLIMKLRIERKREKRIYITKRLKPVIAACALISILAALYMIPQTHVRAFTDKIIKGIIVMSGDTVKVHKKINSTDSEGTNGYTFGRQIDDPRIGEAQKAINFRLFIPEYIPKDFTLESVDVLNMYEGKETVTLLYLNTNSEKNESFEIIQQSYPKGADVTINIKKDDSTKIEQLSIDGMEYTIIGYEKNLNGLMWDRGNIGCEISGNLSRKDILNIAKSMK